MTIMPDYNSYRALFRDKPMPLAFVDMDLLDANIQGVLARAGDKQVRVASKSVRAVAVLQRILDADSRFNGIMAYHPLEAVFLSEHGFDDILIAYPFWHQEYIESVLCEIAKGKQLVAMVDSPEHLEQLGRVAKEQKITLPVCVDVDMSSKFPGLHFGVFRSQIREVEQLEALAAQIDKHEYLRLVGLMGYEAQIAGVQDSVEDSPLVNTVIPILKRISIRELQQRRAAAVAALADYELLFVNGGGTGSLETTSQEPDVTEVTAGSAFFSPGLFDGYRAFKHLPAAGFAVRITRHPESDIYTCLGGGYVASGSAGKDKLPKPYLPAGASLLENEGAGEVQTPIHYTGPEKLEIGDPVFFRHAKSGELCERFNQLYMIADGEIVEMIPTYRGEGESFL